MLRGSVAPILNPRRIFYGSTKRKDGCGDEAAQLRIEDTEVLPYCDGRVGQALSAIPGSTDPGTDPDVLVGVARAGAIEQFAERQYFGAAIFLSTSFGMEPRTVLLTTKKTDLALAVSVKPQRGRAIAGSRRQIT